MITKFNIEKTRQLGKVNKLMSLFFKKPICRVHHSLDTIQNILIIDFALIGDMVMNVPFLKTIRRNCPEAHITIVGMPWAETVLGDQDLVDEFIVFNGKEILGSPTQILKNLSTIRKVLREINVRKYDIGMEPKGDLRHILFLHYTNCERTVSYNYTGGAYLITDSMVPKSDTKHLIDEKLDLLKMIGFSVSEEDVLPVLNISEPYRLMIDRFMKEKQLEESTIIGLHPGASNINKQYRFYPQLIEKLDEHLDEKTVYAVFQGPGEADICDAVCAKLDQLGRPYQRIQRKIKDYVVLVSICDYMICNDSAAGHIAAAYGIPVVVIFGPVKPETALPRGKGIVKYVSHDMECKPCTLPICPQKSEDCIQSVSVDEVYEKIAETGLLEKVS